MPAPVVIFCYNRPSALKKVIIALRSNILAAETDLIIFSDGARSLKDEPAVSEIRNFLSQIDGFRTITIHKENSNKGLAPSIIDGVSQVLEKYEEVIVLEDDIVPLPDYLVFMNQALNKYKGNPRVFSISGYAFPFELEKSDVTDAYFLPRLCSWAWATWREQWSGLDWQIKDYAQFRNDRAAINGFKQAGSDLSRMLDNQQRGKINSWAVRWSYNQFRRGSLTLYPKRSRIKNIGFAEGATHTSGYNKYLSPPDEKIKDHFVLPEIVELKPFYHRQLLEFYSPLSRIFNRFRSLLLRFKLIRNPQ